MIPNENVMYWVSQAAFDRQRQEIEDTIIRIGQMQSPRKISNKTLRMLERIKVLRELDYLTETEANQLAYRVKQAGKKDMTRKERISLCEEDHGKE